MSKLKTYKYFAVTNFRVKPLSFYSLKDKAGIYMITNNVTKKFYIGMSKDLKGRFYNYLDINRLNMNKSNRLHKALLKYGFSSFSITILEFCKPNSSILRKREDFYIKVFKPQYNIKRSFFNLDLNLVPQVSRTIPLVIPLKIKYLLDKCLDPSCLDWNLLSFKFNKTRSSYSFICISPKSFISANSSAWFEGNITKKDGYLVTKRTKKDLFTINSILKHYKLIDKEKLTSFFPKERPDFVKKQLYKKAKALKKLVPKN